MTRRALLFGALAVVLYVTTVAVTLQATGHHVRPLFEGIGPTTPYNWVDPPPEFAAGNEQPKVAETDVPIDAEGTRAAGPTTPDGQLVLAMPGGAVAPLAPDTAVHVRITPLAPDTLAAVPAGLRADGNAYKVEAEYRPSATSVIELAKPGNVILVVPEPATAILFSDDGTAWTALETQQVGGASSTTVGARFERTGYYLGAAPPATSTRGLASGDDVGSVLAVTAATAALALIIGFGPSMVRRVLGRGLR